MGFDSLKNVRTEGKLKLGVNMLDDHFGSHFYSLTPHFYNCPNFVMVDG